MVLAQELAPPVDTREQVLPFDCLAWENFERLCLKLALERGKVDHAVDHVAGDRETGRMSAREARAQGGLYGTRGQKQQGIDLYVRLPPAGDAPPGSGASPRYLSLQSRRVAKLTAAGLKKAVGDFLGGSWASASDVFVYATSLPAVQTELADEIARQTERLAAKGIEFEVWDAEALKLFRNSLDSLEAQYSLGLLFVDFLEADGCLDVGIDTAEVAAVTAGEDSPVLRGRNLSRFLGQDSL
ncbi:hypothetical protein CcI6DRAFT_03727 [Frankia sp. CcI6]|nr:hypothetical protein CcI6DRAFT_03727 [Frankia sp. CcI6]KFB02598.1 hypothetical protein ALLO2DRAFT_04651 [Frankia sp. Allo2]